MTNRKEAKCTVCKVPLPSNDTWSGRLHVCGQQSCKVKFAKRKNLIYIAPGERRCKAKDCENTVAAGYYHPATTTFACSRRCNDRLHNQYAEHVCAYPPCGRGFRGSRFKKYCCQACRDSAYRDASLSRTGSLRSEYLRYEQVIENHYSGQGVKGARVGILRFFEFLRDAGIKDLKKINAKSISDFLTWGGKPVQGYLHFISVYMDWLIFEGVRADNPVTRFHRQRTPKRVPRPYSESEMMRIDKLLEEHGSTQAKLACAIAEEGGCRISEICNLRLEDVHPSGTRLFIRLPNKTMTERWVPVHDKAQKYLAIWLAERDRRVGHDFLLHSKLGKPFHKDTLHYEIQEAVCGRTKNGKVIHEDGLEEWSTHRLRHTMATRLARNGADFATVMSVGGWVSHQSAAGYAGIEAEVAERGYREAMARASAKRSEPSVVKSSFKKYVNAPGNTAG